MAGPSLLQIRQFLAREAGPFHSGTSTGGTTTGQLEDTSWPFKSSISQDSLFKDMWLFMPGVTAADQVRVIKTYSPSSGTGTLDLPHGSAHTTEPYEIHGIFEPATVIPNLVNEGLRECMIPVEFTFQPANDTNRRHPLTVAAPWLTNPGWVRKVGYLPANSQGRDILDPYNDSSIRGGASVDGNIIYLELGAWASSGTFYVYAMKPAYFHCAASAGTYGTQSGLTLDTDTVPDTVSVEWAAYAALKTGWRRYGQVLAANDRVKMSEQAAEVKFAEWDPGYFDRAPELAQRIRHWGPRC